ncbi:hypothetical protein KM043_009465 [Ampulex compressa]|nr:hypothetical protein KM043_009465 [Ampulex compressa]
MSTRKSSCDSLEISDEEKKSTTGKGKMLARRVRCKLDPNDRLNLRDILLSFNGPVSQEQGWALCYQTAKCLSQMPDNKYYELSELSEIVLHKDGDVWLGHLAESKRPHVSEQKAIFSLGMMIFKALDFGLDEEEERPLSPDLETLITLMTNTNQECEAETEDRPQETDDEGIERDSSDADVNEFLQKGSDSYEDKPMSCSLKNVMQVCTRHMQSTTEYAEMHYKAVIHAIVAEALELSQFLETVAAEKVHASERDGSSDADGNKYSSSSLQHLDALDFNDWARFWVQVIQELRRGVKLKKVEANLGSKGTTRGRGKGAEFELTPYEILMDDIREKRYHLRKTPSPTPHLKKDAHAIILEFIRSRPPLRKASERQLPPLQKESTLRELLMESIKKPPNLRSSRNRYIPKIEKTSPYADCLRSPPSDPVSHLGRAAVEKEHFDREIRSTVQDRVGQVRQEDRDTNEHVHFMYSLCGAYVGAHRETPGGGYRSEHVKVARMNGKASEDAGKDDRREARGLLAGDFRRTEDSRPRFFGHPYRKLHHCGESRMIVLGEVPPSQPEQEQEPAQDVAAQWLQTDHQAGATSASSGAATGAPAATGRTRAIPPVPQPRQRIGKPDVRVQGNRNHQSHSSVDAKGHESPSAPKPPRRDLDSTNTTTGRTRKLIPVDFDLKLDAEDDDDDDDEDYNEDYTVTRFEEEDEASNYWHLKEDYPFADRDGIRNGHKCHDHRDDDEAGSANPWRKTGGLRLTRNEYHRFCDTQLESYDLATQCPSRRASARKHAAKRNLPPTTLTGTTSLPHSRPQSRQHVGVTESTLSQGPSPNISLNPSPSLSPQPRARQPRRSHTIAEGKNSEDQNEEWQEDSGQKASLGDMFLDERLSLTLEEIVHIRSVLTKAELESLPVEGRVKEDVEKRRVCFLCLKTRFGLLGPWGQRCRLCKRTVCVKCYSKMRIPTEHFAHVPVVLLSPGLLLSPSTSEPDTGSKNSWLRGNGAVGSAPASPASRRKDSSLRSGTPASTPTTTPVLILTPTSTPPSHARRDPDNTSDKRSLKSGGSPAAVQTPKTFPTFSGQSTEQRLAAERLRGVAVVVCHDCRIMVIQIIKSSRTTRATIRNNVISRLTLNLLPAYV